MSVSSIGSASDEELEVKYNTLNITFPSNKERWISDERCQACLAKLDIPSIAHTKKYCCPFCFRGVCIRCFTASAMHPETQEIVKICDNCEHELKAMELNSIKIHREELGKVQILTEIDMATREKESVTNQRKVMQEELKKAQNMVGHTAQENLEILESLRTEKELNLQRKKEALENIRIANEKHEKIVAAAMLKDQELDGLSKKNTENAEETDKHRKKIAKYQHKRLKLLKKNESKIAETENLTKGQFSVVGQIKEITDKIEFMKERNEKIKEKLESRIEADKKYEEKIEELNESLRFSNSVGEGLVFAEDYEKLKNDLCQIKLLIHTMKKQLKLYKQEEQEDKMPQNVDNKYITSNSISGRKLHKKRKEKDGNLGCQKCCVF